MTIFIPAVFKEKKMFKPEKLLSGLLSGSSKTGKISKLMGLSKKIPGKH